MKKKLFAAILFLFFAVNPVFAQQVASLAINVEVADTSAVEGDIISYTDEGLVRANKPYDILTFGVITAAPVISTGLKTENTKSIVTSGIAKVKVKGPVAAGDIIASSTEPGVGQKATEGGYTLGKAIEKLDSVNTGLVSVDISPSYSSSAGGRVGLFGIASDNLRYLIAAIVGLFTLLFAAVAFIRLVSSGVTAIGRNPLGRRSILISMIIASGVILLICAAGVGAVIAIITLGG